MPEKKLREHHIDRIHIDGQEIGLVPTGQTFSGTFNTLHVFTSEDAGSYVVRVPKPNRQRKPHVASIQDEYNNFGAKAHGVSFRLRSIPQQIGFMDELRKAERKAIQYVGTTSNRIIFPFIEEGTPLHTYLQDVANDSCVVQSVGNHLIESHRQGLIFGDRWGANTMMLPDNDFIELDFDFDLKGRPEVIAAFELAQFMYHVVHFAQHNRGLAVEKLIDIFTEDPKTREIYDMEKLCMFLINQAAFFYDKFTNKGTLYEGLCPPYEEIIDLVRELSSTNAGKGAGEENTIYTFRA